MARAEIPASLSEMRSPQSTQSHIAALKALKHDIIGHEQRKELVIHHGLIRLLVRNLTAAERRREEPGEWSQEDEIRLQSVQIISCLAHGGLAFIQPLVAAGAIKPLLAQLSPSTHVPRLVVESLRAIIAIAEALTTDILSSPDSSGLAQLVYQLFSKPTVDTLAEILAQRRTSMVVEEQVTLVLKIICICLHDEKGPHQAALVKAGALDFICCRLAALVERMGHAAPTMDPAFTASMLPAPSRSSLQYLLEALACLCHKSAYRSMRILYSRHLLEVFPIASPHTQARGEYLSDQSSPQPLNSNPSDHFLPKLQAVQSKNEHSFSKAFPALGSFSNLSEAGSTDPYLGSGHTTVSGRIISADEFGSPLIAWLIHIARHNTGLERLAALEFLAKLISALDQRIMESWAESSRNRDRTLAFLVVPLLIRIIDATDPKNFTTHKWSAEEMAIARSIRERAPVALAILITDVLPLQKAAYDASAINVLGQMLKKSFDTVSAARKPMWTSMPQAMTMDVNGALDDPACSLGSPAMAAENIHRFRCRAASLQALSAIGQREDSYRRSIIEINVVGCLVDSLIPYVDGPMSAVHATDVTTGKDGNPWFVITSACRLAQALSRSVGVLRTKLLDAGIAKPVFALLKERDQRIKAAGTDAVTNLLLQFSPMREVGQPSLRIPLLCPYPLLTMKQELLAQGVVKVLCGHAHSADPDLRNSALWALKHLCASTPNDIKINIVEELGSGWLVQTMSGESSLAHPARSHMATPNAAGEQVDLLNAVDEPVMDVDDEDMYSSSDEDEDDERAYENGATRLPTVPARYTARLRAIRHEEESPTLRARRDDIRIQSQAVDLVRNLICEAGPKQPEMIDNLLQSLGSHRLFDCLATKLKPRVSGVAGKSTISSTTAPNVPAGKRPTLTTPAAASSSSRDKETAAHAARIDTFPMHLYPDADVVLTTLFTIIHIGNGRPQHRHMLLNTTTTLTPQSSLAAVFPSTYPPRLLPQGPQTKLLDLLLPLFSHPDSRLRVACCWMVHNILWQEDQADAPNARQRAAELRNRGFEDAVRSCLGDENLDVRERAKGCLEMWGSGSRDAGSGNGAGIGRLFAGRDREREMRDEVEGRTVGGGGGGGRSWER
jgi:hypothetical protein